MISNVILLPCYEIAINYWFITIGLQQSFCSNFSFYSMINGILHSKINPWPCSRIIQLSKEIFLHEEIELIAQKEFCRNLILVRCVWHLSTHCANRIFWKFCSTHNFSRSYLCYDSYKVKVVSLSNTFAFQSYYKTLRGKKRSEIDVFLLIQHSLRKKNLL